jgi:hypothetical protein
MEPQLGEHHSGQLRHESAEAKGERITAEESRRLKWKERDLRKQPKGQPQPLTALKDDVTDVRFYRVTTNGKNGVRLQAAGQ